MATGDVAAAAGLQVFVGTQDIKQGYNNDNVRGDELGAHLISGTHPASAITSGVFDETRIPTLTAAKIPNLDATKITTGAIAAARITYVNGSAVYGSIDVASHGSGSDRATALITPGTLLASGVATTPLGSWTSVVTNSSGYLGYASSNRASKQNIVPTAIPEDAALGVQIVDFRYRADVKEFGDEAPLNVGVIAEQLIDAGLEQLVIKDAAGKVKGVHYERLAVVLFPTVQMQARQITDLTARLEALEK
jgi:hypothetical protein